MLGTLLITLRETIEASLIVGILLAYLAKIQKPSCARYVYAGTFAAILASLLFAFFSLFIAQFFDEERQGLFEAGILMVSTGVLTHMVVWMHHHARTMKGDLQQKTDVAISGGHLWAIGVLAFLGVWREGVETVLFLWGLFLQEGASASGRLSIVGGLFGVGLGVVIAWLFFKGLGHLDLRPFFRVTGIVLIFMAAGMFSSSMGKLIVEGYLPPLIDQIWNSTWLLDEHRFWGSLVAGLLGYRSRPSLLELAAWLTYLFSALFWLGQKPLQTRIKV